MQKYIGLDDHATSCSFGVLSEHGKRLGSAVVETSGQALVGFVGSIAGCRHLCLEEGTRSNWLYELLSPHVYQIVVTHAEKHPGDKDDIRDAFRLAEQLRTGTVKPVFKDKEQFSLLRALSDVYRKIKSDKVRVQNRIRALFRSRGVPEFDRTIYVKSQQEKWLKKLPPLYVAAGRLLYAEHDAIAEVKKEASKLLLEQSRRHAISRVLQTCPGLGEVRVALLMATVVSPHRFRTKRQFWSYCGLAVVMRSSSDWEFVRNINLASRL
jgi:transposase